MSVDNRELQAIAFSPFFLHPRIHSNIVLVHSPCPFTIPIKSHYPICGEGGPLATFLDD